MRKVGPRGTAEQLWSDYTVGEQPNSCVGDGRGTAGQLYVVGTVGEQLSSCGGRWGQ